MDRILSLSCGILLIGLLKMSFSGFLPGRDLGNKSYMGHVLGKPIFETLTHAYVTSIQFHLFNEEVLC